MVGVLVGLVVVVVLSLVLVFCFTYWGVALASLLTGISFSWIVQALRGFGNPTGNMPAFNYLDPKSP